MGAGNCRYPDGWRDAVGSLGQDIPDRRFPVGSFPALHAFDSSIGTEFNALLPYLCSGLGTFSRSGFSSLLARITRHALRFPPGRVGNWGLGSRPAPFFLKVTGYD